MPTARPETIQKMRSKLQSLLGLDLSLLSNDQVEELSDEYLKKEDKYISDITDSAKENTTLHRMVRKFFKKNTQVSRFEGARERDLEDDSDPNLRNRADRVISQQRRGSPKNKQFFDTEEFNKSFFSKVKYDRETLNLEKFLGIDTDNVDDVDNADDVGDAADQINDIEESVANIEEVISEQNTSLDGIVDGLREERDAENNLKNIAKKNSSREQRRKKKQRERKNRLKRENASENAIKGLVIGIQKTLAPVSDVFDNIFRFISNIFLGKILEDLLTWASDPKNKSKVKNILRFLQTWWPAILGSYILFGTTFGKFIRASIGATIKGVGALIKAIGFLKTQRRMGNLRGAASGMLGKGGKAGLIGAAALGTVAIGSAIFSAASTPKEEKELESSGDDLEGFSAPELQFSGGGENDLSNMKPFDTEDGGIVKGKKGKDKNLGWLTDGEIVLTEKARDRAIKETGMDPLVFNMDGSPDANRPTIKNETYYASGGGVIGRDKYSGRETTAAPKMMMPNNSFSNSYLDYFVNNISNISDNSFRNSTNNISDNSFRNSTNNISDNSNNSDIYNISDNSFRNFANNISDNSFKNSTNIIFDNSLLMPENMVSSEQLFNMPFVNGDKSFSTENNFMNYPMINSSNKSFSTENNFMNYPMINSSNRFFDDNTSINNSKAYLKNIFSKILDNSIVNNIIEYGSSIFNLGNTVRNNSDISSSTIIKENTGVDIPGGTSDRQRMSINVQPGEAHVIVPNEVVQRGGLHHIENIINMYDDGTSFASRNSGNIEMPEPPQTKQPRVTFISSPDQNQTIESGSTSNDIEMFDATFVSSRKLKTLGVG